MDHGGNAYTATNPTTNGEETSLRGYLVDYAVMRVTGYYCAASQAAPRFAFFGINNSLADHKLDN